MIYISHFVEGRKSSVAHSIDWKDCIWRTQRSPYLKFPPRLTGLWNYNGGVKTLQRNHKSPIWTWRESPSTEWGRNKKWESHFKCKIWRLLRNVIICNILFKICFQTNMHYITMDRFFLRVCIGPWISIECYCTVCQYGTRELSKWQKIWQ